MRLLYRTHGTTPDIDKVGSYSYKLLGLSERSAAEQGHFNMGAPATMPISSLSSFSLQQLLSWLLLNSQSTEEKGMCDFPACGHSPPA